MVVRLLCATLTSSPIFLSARSWVAWTFSEHADAESEIRGVPVYLKWWNLRPMVCEARTDAYVLRLDVGLVGYVELLTC